MLEFQFVLTEQMLFDYNYYNLYNSPMNKKSVYVFKWVIPFLFTGFMLLLAGITRFNLDVLLFPAIVFGTITIIWLLAYNKIIIFAIRKNIKRLKRNDKEIFSLPSTVRFGEENIEMVSDKLENKLQYSLIKSIVHAKNAIYCHIESEQVIIIPKIVFKTTEEKDSFLKLLVQKTGLQIKEVL